MQEYRNGDRCPCCGGELSGKDAAWLRLFGRLCEALGLEKEEVFAPEHQEVPFPPPDAGIHPPMKPTK